MGDRYVALVQRTGRREPRGWEYEPPVRPAPATIVVTVEVDDPIPTGIYDAAGVQLYRLPEHGLCGFHRK